MFILYQCPLDLYLGTSVPEIFEIPTSIEFVRDYVAKNIPVVIREGNHFTKNVCTNVLKVSKMLCYSDTGSLASNH